MKCLILSAVLLAPAARNAHALAEPRNNCVRFLGESGEELREVCRRTAPTRVKYTGPASPLGRSWDWVEETPQPSTVYISGSRNYAVVVENFSRTLAGGHGGSDMDRSDPALPGGYRLFCYGDEGNLIWQKTSRAGRFAQSVRLSSDDSLAVVVTGANAADAPPEQVTVYDMLGRHLLTFPEKTGVCALSAPGGVWLSASGDFMMVPCTGSRPYFFQPKSRLVWRADKQYSMLSNVQRSSSDPLEETPGEGLVTYELDGGQDGEPGDNTLNLYGVPWRGLGRRR